MATTESITWFPVAEQLPDDNATVLVRLEEGADEPVWLGYLDGEDWTSAEGVWFGKTVVAWAHMPQGPALEVLEEAQHDAA